MKTSLTKFIHFIQSPIEEEEDESAEDENREEADEAKGRVYTKVKESARKDGA